MNWDCAVVEEPLRRPLEADLRNSSSTVLPLGGPSLEVLEPFAEEDFPAMSSSSSSGRLLGRARVHAAQCAGRHLQGAGCQSGAAEDRRQVVHVEVTTNFGRKNESRRYYTLLLPRQRGTFTVADVTSDRLCAVKQEPERTGT